jgi:tRNA threonylcarbamoyladenosine biosynthesis protein TsaE
MSRALEASQRELPPETFSSSEGETEELGRRLAGVLRPDDVVYLRGALGAGKTALARGIAAGRGAPAREVASPTFAILHEYVASGGAVVLRHLDLYRLADSSGELEILGLPEALGGAPVVVEWPGRAIEAALPATLEIAIDPQPDGSRRIRVKEFSTS